MIWNPADYYELRKVSVEAEWKKQGIWDDDWPHGEMRLWTHEQPLDHDTDSEREDLFGLPPRPRPKSATKLLQNANARLERRREKDRCREASRPFHQFKYQVDKEREYIRVRIAGRKHSAVSDLDELVYHTVRNRWIDGDLWFTEWDPLPGMQWMHEMLHEEVADDTTTALDKHDLSQYILQPSSPGECEDGQSSYQSGQSYLTHIYTPPNPSTREQFSPAQSFAETDSCSPIAHHGPHQYFGSSAFGPTQVPAAASSHVPVHYHEDFRPYGIFAPIRAQSLAERNSDDHINEPRDGQQANRVETYPTEQLQPSRCLKRGRQARASKAPSIVPQTSKGHLARSIVVSKSRLSKNKNNSPTGPAVGTFHHDNLT